MVSVQVIKAVIGLIKDYREGAGLMPRREKTSDATYQLSTKHYSRARQYYHAFYMLAAGFAKQHGRKLQANEQQTMQLLAQVAPLFDDLQDAREGQENIPQMMQQLDDYQPKSQAGKLLLDTAIQLRSTVAEPDRMIVYLKQLADAQLGSAEQQGSPSTERLKQITADKGGYATLIVRSALHEEVSPAEEQATYQLGYASQLMDDIFDYYDDWQNGVLTLPHKLQELAAIEDLYRTEVNTTLKAFTGLQMDNNRLKAFVRRKAVLLSGGLVCLQQFEKLNGGKGKFIINPNRPRTAYICDLETAPNVWRLMRFAAAMT